MCVAVYCYIWCTLDGWLPYILHREGEPSKGTAANTLVFPTAANNPIYRGHWVEYQVCHDPVPHFRVPYNVFGALDN